MRRRPRPARKAAVRRERSVTALLRPAAAFAALVGILCSPRLWLSSGRLFPATPLWAGIPQPPFPLDYFLLIATLASLTGVAVASRPRRWIQAFLVLLGILLIFDQTRWQPWMVLYAVLLAAFLFAPRTETVKRSVQAQVVLAAETQMLDLCRVYLICMYIFAGLQKFQYSFAVLVASLLSPELQRFQMSIEWLTAENTVPLALSMAAAECAAGVLLAFQKTRRWAVYFLISMHVLLVVWLGPLGVDLNSVVWPWNIAMVVFLLLLFRHKDEWTPGLLWRRHLSTRVCAVLITVFPTLALTGIWDSPLGFSLYTGRSKEGYIQVGQERIADLPPLVQRVTGPGGTIQIANWCEEALGVYPWRETGIFTSAGKQVAEWLGPEAKVRLVELGKPGRFTGKREATEIDIQ